MKLARTIAAFVLMLGLPAWAQQWDGTYVNNQLRWENQSPNPAAVFTGVDTVTVSGSIVSGHVDFQALSGVAFPGMVDWTGGVTVTIGTQETFSGTGQFQRTDATPGAVSFSLSGFVDSGVLTWWSTDTNLPIGDVATLQAAAVPEPGTWLQLMAGLAGLAGLKWRVRSARPR